MKTINHLLNILVNILLVLLTYFYLKIHYYYYNLSEWDWSEDRYILSLLFISIIFFISITSLFLYSIYKIKNTNTLDGLYTLSTFYPWQVFY